jgi:transposase
MSPTLWKPKPTNIKHLRAMAKCSDTLIETRQQDINRLDVADPLVQPDIESHITEIDALITDMKLRIEVHINEDPDLNRIKELLLSISGIGEKTISTLLSYFSDVEQFDNAKKLA